MDWLFWTGVVIGGGIALVFFIISFAEYWLLRATLCEAFGDEQADKMLVAYRGRYKALKVFAALYRKWRTLYGREAALKIIMRSFEAAERGETVNDLLRGGSHGTHTRIHSQNARHTQGE
jgi:hypothetical protein